ncbi:class I tRNA ligase family protein [Mesobacillus subterraneus]|uniref:class I tRNA ligase family protein n=1 Tax=Mesobacillus subterraneus TaxID=285983 RepID=UPI00203B0A06|nr:class I tRNA ligase family protein [Mesobacillus subterraneus]MCM3666378.1 class I tRNA ligase family protein [Mesobacillus subterraneus]MCM3685350.1 class I tRNA ligase family protein [Mesobacillus subterraneus]
MNKDVLIVPMQPTPNGRMHIGHGSGTYLRSDVLGRALRVRGHAVSIISGSDAFENWILAESKRTGKSPDSTCDFYHEAIMEDLNNLDIHLDEWIDPRSPEHFPGYLETHEKILTRLYEKGNAKLESERVPYSKESGQAMMGTWISGKCPHCQKPCGGSSCVYCGAHFQPEEIIEPTSRLDNSTLEWILTSNWFARPIDSKQILDSLKKSGVKPSWLKAAEEYLSHSGGRIRLSGPGTWGIKSNMVPEGFVLANPYYLYSVYCGEVYKSKLGTELHPFDSDSEVSVIGVFGSDNSTPGLVAPHVIAQGSDGLLKPFDMTIVNGMLFLEGQKCSTSKRHGIWLDEIKESNTGISSDELRFFLSQVPLDEGVADITLDEMVHTILMYRKWYQEILIPAIHSVSENKYSIKYSDSLERAISRQTQMLSPSQFDLTKVVSVLKDWMYEEPSDKGEWLLGLSLLGAPIFPKLSQQIWSQLGLVKSPNIEEIPDEVQGHLLPESFVQNSNELSVSKLKPFVHLTEVHI